VNAKKGRLSTKIVDSPPLTKNLAAKQNAYGSPTAPFTVSPPCMVESPV